MKRDVVVPVAVVLALLGAAVLVSRSGPAFAEAPSALDEVREYPGVDVVLEPPSKDAAVSADQALGVVAKAWPSATSYTGVLADYTNTAVASEEKQLLVDVTAWVIEADGVCVPVFGGRFYEGGGCAGTRIYVVVDASTGDWITSFATQSDEA